MRARSLFRAGVGALLLFQLLSVFAAVALLARMSPAVDRILEENVRVLDAVDQAALALDAGDREGFAVALDELVRLLAGTEDEEQRAALESLRAHAEAALDGDPRTTLEVLSALRALRSAHRQAMVRARDHALWLGSAGAWAMVLLGFASVVTSAFLARRVETRVFQPLEELRAAVDAAVRDPLRRCPPVQTVFELRHLSQQVNAILDQRASQLTGDAELRSLRAALRSLLDRQPEALVVTGPRGEVLVANRAAVERIFVPGEESFSRFDCPDDRRVASREPLGDGLGWLCRLRAEEVPEADEARDGAPA